MKDTGVIRRLDELGRITLPIELRKRLDLTDRDELQIFVENEQIILQKYEANDIFTGDTKDLIEYKGKMVSKKTIRRLAKMAGYEIQ